MPSIMYPNDKVTYIARKNFKLGDKQFKTGDDAPEMNDHPKLEVFVRNGYVIPVVEDKEDLPFQFRRTVMTRELAYKKLRIGNPAGAPTGIPRDPGGTNEFQENDGLAFNPADHNIEEVLDYVDNNPDEVLSVYALEEDGKNRPRLLSKLDERLNKQAAEENEEENTDV